MTIPHTLAHIAQQLHAAPGLIQAGAAAFGLAAIGSAITLATYGRRRIRNASKNRAKAITALTNLAAIIATGVQASGMWKFFGNTMGLPVGFRIFMFSFMEIALLACGMRARMNVEEGGDAGIDGILVWGLAIASGLMSSTEANSPQEAAMRVVVSGVVAVLWSRDLLAAKKAARAAAGGKKRSPVRWRITGERIAVWLRLADAVDTDVSTVDAARRVGKFLRQSDRERNGFRWPFTAKARAYRGRMRLIDNALRHGDPTGILTELAGLAFTDALDRAKTAAAGQGQTDNGPADRTGPTRTGGPDHSGPTGPADRTRTTGPDRTGQTGPADRINGTDRTGPKGKTGPQHADHTGPDRTNGPDQTTQTGPDHADQTDRTDQTRPANQTVSRRPAGNGADLKDLEAACRTWAANNNMNPAQMSRRQVLEAIRSVGLTCSNERAGKVLLLLDPKGAVAWMNEAMADQTGQAADQTDRTDRTEMAGPR